VHVTFALLGVPMQISQNENEHHQEINFLAHSQSYLKPTGQEFQSI
jgi:hypothetical protein